MKEICPKEKCTGCSSCYNACKHKAIEMKADTYGFIYPVVKQNQCIDCGLCQKVCPVNYPQQLLYPNDCYATTLQEENDLMKSASGGAATAFMRKFINQEGIVYGCTGEDIYHVHHIRIDSIIDIEKLRGSKYVQSDISDTYSQVLADIKLDKSVLYIGTPCQIAGLRAFLRKDYEKLFLVDLVCHGVPSQKMLTDNIHCYTRESNGKDLKVSFRRKLITKKSSSILNSARIEYGWFLQTPSKSIIEKTFFKDSYMLGFLSCLTFRESCYSCRYATSARISDITIADFWGLGRDAGFENGKGVSVCLINTTRGMKLFEQAKELLIVVRRDPVEAIMGNGQLQYPSKRHANHKLFKELYPQLGLSKSICKCLKKEIREYNVIKPLKTFIKKMFYK